MRSYVVTIEFHQLRYAVATADSKSFSRAAAALNVKQITLSRRVQQLEDRLGVKLFERSTRGAELTENGRVVIEHPMQQAMIIEGAVQCGFCTPGIVLAGAALLARNADPGEAEIRAALTNLCPCGTYPRLVRAVQRAGRIARGVEAPPKTGPVPALKSV